MKFGALTRTRKTLPARGNSLVTITAVDENGFTVQYEEVEVPNGALKTAIATIHLEAKSDAESREMMNSRAS